MTKLRLTTAETSTMKLSARPAAAQAVARGVVRGKFWLVAKTRPVGGQGHQKASRDAVARRIVRARFIILALEATLATAQGLPKPAEILVGGDFKSRDKHLGNGIAARRLFEKSMLHIWRRGAIMGDVLASSC